MVSKRQDVICNEAGTRNQVHGRFADRHRWLRDEPELRVGLQRRMCGGEALSPIQC
jgi:hypothetical protein